MDALKSRLPLYHRVARKLEEQITSGLIGTDGVLPAERILADALKISRVTLRKSLDLLETEGLIEKKHGSGTFLKKAGFFEQTLSALTSFTEDMETRQLRAGAVWLERSIAKASPEESLNLGLSPNEAVCRLYRIRMADNEPMALEYAILPLHIVGDPAKIKGSLYAHLRHRGFAPHRALQKLKASQITDTQAQLLGLKENDPVLYIERKTMMKDGTPLEFVRSHYRGDLYDFIVELNLSL